MTDEKTDKERRRETRKLRREKRQEKRAKHRKRAFSEEAANQLAASLEKKDPGVTTKVIKPRRGGEQWFVEARDP